MSKPVIVTYQSAYARLNGVKHMQVSQPGTDLHIHLETLPKNLQDNYVPRIVVDRIYHRIGENHPNGVPRPTYVETVISKGRTHHVLYAMSNDLGNPEFQWANFYNGYRVAGLVISDQSRPLNYGMIIQNLSSHPTPQASFLNRALEMGVKLTNMTSCLELYREDHQGKSVGGSHLSNDELGDPIHLFIALNARLSDEDVRQAQRMKDQLVTTENRWMLFSQLEYAISSSRLGMTAQMLLSQLKSDGKHGFELVVPECARSISLTPPW